MSVDTRFFDGGWPMKIGDTEYLACMLTDQNYADLTQYIRAKYLELAEKASKSLLDGGHSERMSIVFSNLVNIGWNTKEGMDIIFTEDGLMHLGYYMCKKKHPRLTLAVFKESFDKDVMDSVTQIYAAYERLNFPASEDELNKLGAIGGAPTENTKSE